MFDTSKNGELIHHGGSKCETLFKCFTNILNDGFTNGQGILQLWPSINYFYDIDTSRYTLKLFINLLFFLTINTVALNIIFGIIIDTFADLRDTTAKEGRFIFCDFIEQD